MKSLCIDTFSIVLSFLNYRDYTILTLTNNQIKYLVYNLTTLPELLDIMRTENISWKQKEKLIYHCCSLKRTDIAKSIIAQNNVTLFPLRDIFFHNYCDRNDIRTIRRVLKLKGVDISKYDFLKKEEYSKYLELLKYMVEDTDDTIESLNDRFIEICSLQQSDIYVKIFHVFGDFKLLDINAAFVECYHKSNYDAMIYILSVYSVSKKTLIKVLNNACRYNCIRVVEILTCHFSFERYVLIRAARLCCSNNSYSSLVSLSTRVIFTKEEKSNLFQIICSKNNINCFSFLISSVDEDNIRKSFILACKNKSIQIFEQLISKSLDQETINQGFIQCCLANNIQTAKYLFKNRNIEKSILMESFCKVCSANNIDAAKFLLKRLKIDENSRRSILLDSCRKGNKEIVVLLLEIKKLGLFERRDCFLECCRNKQIHLLNLFADPSFEFFIKNARKKVAKEELLACFRKACLENNLKMVGWISKMLDRIDEFLICKMIKECTNQGNCEVVAWLLDKISIKDDFAKKCFLESCKYGCDDLMKLFIYTGKIDNYTIQIGFSISCRYGHSNIYSYLYVVSNIDIGIIEKTKYMCIRKGRHVSARWLNSLLNKQF